jgi:hypothetical protein
MSNRLEESVYASGKLLRVHTQAVRKRKADRSTQEDRPGELLFLLFSKSKICLLLKSHDPWSEPEAPKPTSRPHELYAYRRTRRGIGNYPSITLGGKVDLRPTHATEIRTMASTTLQRNCVGRTTRTGAQKWAGRNRTPLRHRPVTSTAICCWNPSQLLRVGDHLQL